MIFTKSDIRKLLAAEPITNRWPWSTDDPTVVENYFKEVIADIRDRIDVLDQTVYDAYGSGYAGYIDCWLFREDDQFRTGQGQGHDYIGLVVLFSHLSHYYVLGEGRKSRRLGSGASYLPTFEFVD